jgi:hypothetical protein
VRARDEAMLAANRNAWQQWRPFGPVDLWVEQEPGSGGKESADATIDLHRGLPMRAERPSGEKRVRAEPFASMAERRDKVCLLATIGQLFSALTRSVRSAPRFRPAISLVRSENSQCLLSHRIGAGSHRGAQFEGRESSLQNFAGWAWVMLGLGLLLSIK